PEFCAAEKFASSATVSLSIQSHWPARWNNSPAPASKSARIFWSVIARTGFRISDLMQPRLFSKKLQAKNRENNAVLRALGARPIDYDEVNKNYLAAGRSVRPFVTN